MMDRNLPTYNEFTAQGAETGFMLLEVMASVAILGLAVVAVIQLFSGSLGLARASSEYTDMVLLAREKMTETLLSESLEEGTASGATIDGRKWTVEVGEYGEPGSWSVENPGFAVYRVVVKTGGEGQRDRKFKLTTLKTVIK